MKILKKSSTVFLILLSLRCLGCGGDATGGTEVGTTASSTLSINLKLANESQAVSGSSSLRSFAVGQTSASTLSSLKYYITSITICESMDTVGTAFTNASGCIELYKGNQNDPTYTYTLGEDYSRFADPARASDTGFIDLMDDTARGSLSSVTTLGADDVRSYNYGFITWYLPVKVKADVSLSNGDVYRTKDGTTSSSLITTAPGTFADGTAEEAVLVLGNGGSWFKFQNPFVISQSDVDSTTPTQYSLDLTFNPEGFLKAFSSDVGGCGGCNLKDSLGNQIAVPLLDLNPVPHKTAEKVLRESYVAIVQSGTDNFNIRLELYSIENDPNKTIYGVDTATLMNGSTTTAVSPFPKVSFVASGNDGNLEFEDYQGAAGPLVTGFKRQTQVGSTFTSTLHCGAPAAGGFMVDACSDGQTKEITFTLQSILALN